ncbi:MAG: flagellar export chaperone FlgN [Gemmatimonadota bacterium]|nr:flagellar export chaperone FlgN [Gemmatimonadota bacterium]
MKQGKKTMIQLPGKLHRLLSAMADGLERLYDCLRTQQSALMNMKLDEFNQATQLQSSLAEKNLEQDRQRKELIGRTMGTEYETVPLKKLAAGLDPPWPDRFEAVAERIRLAGNKVETMKKQNEFLIGRSKQMVETHIKLLIEFANINRNIYGQSGRKKKKPNVHKVLDAKI